MLDPELNVSEDKGGGENQQASEDLFSSYEIVVSDSDSEWAPSENEELSDESDSQVTHRGDEMTAKSNKRLTVSTASTGTPNNVSEYPSSSGNQAPKETDEGSEEFCSRDPQASEVTTEAGNEQTHIHKETSEETFENSPGVEKQQASCGMSLKKTKKKEDDPYKKPKRYFIFCKQIRSKLSQHIASQHRDIERVKRALENPKKQQEQAFSTFKKEGIWEANKQHARNNTNFERERSTNKAVLEPRVSPAFAITYFCNHCNI